MWDLSGCRCGQDHRSQRRVCACGGGSGRDRRRAAACCGLGGRNDDRNRGDRDRLFLGKVAGAAVSDRRHEVDRAVRSRDVGEARVGAAITPGRRIQRVVGRVEADAAGADCPYKSNLIVNYAIVIPTEKLGISTS